MAVRSGQRTRSSRRSLFQGTHRSGSVHESSFRTEPTLVQEFSQGGHNYRVSIWYGTNSGPTDTGFENLRDLGPDPRVRGFPVLKAEVDSSGRGYANILGWIQVVAHLRPDGSVEDWEPDLLPALRERDVPFCSWAYHPTFFDAPFWPDRPQLHWRADLFLCPMTIRDPAVEEIVPIAGFRWGFRIPSDGADPELLPLATVGADAWKESVPGLRSWFPNWRFGNWANKLPQAGGARR